MNVEGLCPLHLASSWGVAPMVALLLQVRSQPTELQGGGGGLGARSRDWGDEEVRVRDKVRIRVRRLPG